MNGWDIKEFVDELVFELDNGLRYLKSRQSARAAAPFSKLPQDWSIYEQFQIILGGPSSNNFHTPLDEAHQVFVNFGFQHKSFPFCKSPWLLICDSKFMTGEWSMDMLDEALAVNSNTKFILNSIFLDKMEIDSFAAYRGRIAFINHNRMPTRFTRNISGGSDSFNIGGGAGEQAMTLAAALGAKSIDIFGLDGNNVILGLLDRNTHFYGVDDAKDWTNPAFSARELRFLSYFIDRHRYLSKLMAKNGISIRNHSDSFTMSMYKASRDYL